MFYLTRWLAAGPRRAGFYHGRLAPVAGLALLVLGLVYATIGGNEPPNGLALFTLLGQVMLLLACLAMPLAALGGFAHEHEGPALSLLLLTTLTPRDLAVGKLVAVVGRAVLVLLALAPLLLLCRSLGGVEVAQIGWLYVLALATVVLGSAAGLWVSTWCDTRRQAVGGALLAATLLFYALPEAVLLARANVEFLTQDLWLSRHLLPTLSPHQAFASMLAQRNGTSQGLSFALVALLLAALATLATVRRLARREGGAPSPARVGSTAHAWPRRPALLDTMNPIGWRERSEISWKLFGGSLALAGLAVVPWGLAVGHPWETALASIFVVSAVLFGLGVILRSSLAFSQDHHSGSLELLLLTGVSADELVMGKYWASIRGGLPWLGSMVVTLLGLGYHEQFVAFVLAANLAITMTFAYSLAAMWWSLVGRPFLAVVTGAGGFALAAYGAPALTHDTGIAVGAIAVHLALGLYLLRRIYQHVGHLAGA